MAQYRMNAYDADVWIPEFKGLMQYGDQMGTDLRYSPDCMNVETPAGVLQPVPKMKGSMLARILWRANNNEDDDEEEEEEEEEEQTTYDFPFDGYNGTVMCVRSLVPIEEADLEMGEYPIDAETYKSDTLPAGWVYIAVDQYLFMLGENADQSSSGTDATIYYYNQYGRNLPEINDIKIDKAVVDQSCLDAGIYNNGDLPASGWSWCTYTEKLPNAVTIEGSSESSCTLPKGTPVDVLLFSHPNLGLFMYGWYFGQIKKISAPSKFEFIERYADRIWGVGAGDNKDRLFYSRPYSATNWTQDNANPANGGGEIQEPTFDDDRLTGIKHFGDSLIAFTKKRAWRITGTDPSNFVIQEQYGNGTAYPDTIAEFDETLIMLSDDGLVKYDGERVTPFFQEMTYEIFRKIVMRRSKPTAMRVGDKYVLALSNEAYFPFKTDTDGFEASDENGNPVYGHVVPSAGYQLLVFNMSDKSMIRMDSPMILSMVKARPYMLVRDIVNDQTRFFFTRLQFDSWYTKQVTDKATKWVSPWVTFERQDIKKGGFDFYFTPEVEPKKTVTHQLLLGNITTKDPELITTESSGSVTFRISIQTESKLKTKTYTVQPLTEAQIAAGKQYKQKRLHFGGSGRRFRVIIETEAGNTIPWRLVGGIHIIAEIDKD